MSFDHLYVLFGEVIIQVLGPVLIGLFDFLVLNCINSLYILEINPLSDVSLMNMLSHTVGFLFTLLMVSFSVHSFLV